MRTLQRAMAVVTMAMVGVVSGRTTQAQPAARQVLRVLITDNAGVAAGDVRRAQDVAGQIFQQIDVDIVWLDRSEFVATMATVQDEARGVYSASIVHLQLVPPDMAAAVHPRANILGMATPGGNNAYILVSRIKNRAAELDLLMADLMGHVMAHEMGHLLLGTDSHSVSGIMTASMDVGRMQIGALSFDQVQAARIRQKLAASGWPLS